MARNGCCELLVVLGHLLVEGFGALDVGAHFVLTIFDARLRDREFGRTLRQFGHEGLILFA